MKVAQVEASESIYDKRYTIKVLHTSFLPQGVYLKKNWQGGSAYFFGSEIFEILIFLGLENLSYFLGSNDFSLIFFG